MKQSILILAAAFTLLSCNEQTKTVKKDDLKIGYIEVDVLLENYDKFKDEEEKMKVRTEEAERPIVAKGRQLENEMASLQKNAQTYGEAWAQQKYAQLQQRGQQFQQERQAAMAKLEEEFAVKRDTLSAQVRRFIKDFAKKEKYDYLLTTSKTEPNVIYGKDSYNVTKVLQDKLNAEYKTTKNKK